VESVSIASASHLYLKGGAYMAIESPTDGPNDVVSNNTRSEHYGIAGDGDFIPRFPCLVRVDALTGADPPTGVVMPCLVETAPGRSVRRGLP
jgi:hypothetical protein